LFLIQGGLCESVVRLILITNIMLPIKTEFLFLSVEH
jgi:hypothetical protein